MSNLSLHQRAACGVAAAVTCMLALGCGDPVTPEPARERQLLFLSEAVSESSSGGRNLGADIHRMGANGAGRENLTRDPATYGSIGLAPDGRRVAFYSTRAGCPAVWSMNVDGTDIRLLTPFELRCNRVPRWSPDGKHIAFQSTAEGRYSIYVMNADGSEPRNVSHPSDEAADFVYLGGWTPDGRVVFMHGGGGTTLSTFTVNPDGTDQRRLLEREGDLFPRWSPDGSKVAFMRQDGDLAADLYVMNADGSDLRQVTDLDGYVELYGDYLTEGDHEYWSPDGSRIAFHHLIPDVGRALYVVRTDGTGLVKLSDAHEWGGDRFNGWSPDGRVTLHRKAAGGLLDLFLVEPDGSGLVNLTNSAATHDFYAFWLPEQ